MDRYTQSANGHFTCRIVPGSPHCGAYDRDQTIRYRVDIVYRANPLDHNGFLLDNTSFREFFARVSDTPVSVSCENLARNIAHAMHESRMESITVKLSAVPGVWIGVTYRQE